MAIALQLSDVIVIARGRKTARLRASDGAADVIYSTANNGLCAPLGPGNFDKSAALTRMKFEARLDDEDDPAFFDGLNAWALQYVVEHSERLLKRTMTPEQAAPGYHPCVCRKDGHAPLLHTKVNTEGSSALRCGDADGAARAQPREWTRKRLQLRFHVSHLWIMGAGFGLVINSTAAQVLSPRHAAAERVCPL